MEPKLQFIFYNLDEPTDHDQSALVEPPVVDEFEIEDDVPNKKPAAPVSKPVRARRKRKPTTEQPSSNKGAISAAGTVNLACPDPSICAMRKRAFDDTSEALCGAHTALSVRRSLMVIGKNEFLPLYKDFGGELRPLCKHTCHASRQHFKSSTGKKFVRGVRRFFGLT